MVTVLDHLTSEGKRQFNQEVIEAMAQESENWRPVERVVEAWYRTWRFRQEPEHNLATTEAHARFEGEIPWPEQGQTVEELRKELEG